tara:strand:+ start:3318 stop:3584 length:267 start_codon:yes stop_codon:yes gene_type:complete
MSKAPPTPGHDHQADITGLQSAVSKSSLQALIGKATGPLAPADPLLAKSTKQLTVKGDGNAGIVAVPQAQDDTFPERGRNGYSKHCNS